MRPRFFRIINGLYTVWLGLGFAYAGEVKLDQLGHALVIRGNVPHTVSHSDLSVPETDVLYLG